jgi:hypothetical protein
VIAFSPADFARAIDAYRFRPYEFDPVALETAEASLAATGMLVVGESHGVAETSAVLGALSLRLRTRGIAFEWSHEELDDVVQRFVEGGPLDLDRLWRLPGASEFFCGDGRVAAGHFALLGRMRAEGTLEQVVLFDRLDPEPPPDDPGVRERDLAERLVAEAKATVPLLVLAGAFHARLDADAGETMASRLAAARPGLAAAMLAFESGEGWSRGATYDLGSPMPIAPVVLHVGPGTPAIVPGLH